MAQKAEQRLDDLQHLQSTIVQWLQHVHPSELAGPDTTNWPRVYPREIAALLDSVPATSRWKAGGIHEVSFTQLGRFCGIVDGGWMDDDAIDFLLGVLGQLHPRAVLLSGTVAHALSAAVTEHTTITEEHLGRLVGKHNRQRLATADASQPPVYIVFSRHGHFVAACITVGRAWFFDSLNDGSHDPAPFDQHVLDQVHLYLCRQLKIAPVPTLAIQWAATILQPDYTSCGLYSFLWVSLCLRNLPPSSAAWFSNSAPAALYLRLWSLMLLLQTAERTDDEVIDRDAEDEDWQK